MALVSLAGQAPTEGLVIATVRFGAVEQVVVAPSALFSFPEALPGLPESHRYALIGDESSAPLFWLQSLEDQAACLPVVESASLVVSGYAEHVGQSLGADHDERVFVVARFDPEANSFVVNLLAPVILDQRAGTGRQIVLDGQGYPLRQAVRWDAAARNFTVPC
ncbi:MAG TPA: flagellar assembly protein FliW [Chloroflexota bacterium]